MSETKTINYEVLIAQKTERLVTALYLVTDLVDKEEPIKNKARSVAIDLLQMVTKVASSETGNLARDYSLSVNSAREIMSLIHVATHAGLVSHMNGKLLSDGFASLSRALSEWKPEVSAVLNKEELSSEKTERVTTLARLSPTFVSYKSKREYENESEYLEEERVGGVPASQVHKESRAVPVSTVAVAAPTKENQTQSFVTANLKQDIPEEREKFVVQAKPVKDANVGVFKARKLSRRDQIVALLTRGVDVSIKDISSKIKGCSEKTIQRELNALVFDHVIERIGEKRWSRYVLR